MASHINELVVKILKFHRVNNRKPLILTRLRRIRCTGVNLIDMSRRLRVLTYNIHKGVSFLYRKNAIEMIRQAIRSTHADLVFLQEVEGTPSASFTSQFEHLADQAWSHFSYGKNAVHTDGHHGNAILSQYPIIEWTNFDVSQSRLEQRGILRARIHDPENEKTLSIYCLHFGLMASWRERQCDALIELIQTDSRKDPLIICGDCNDWRDTLSERLFSALSLKEAFVEKRGEPARSFPSFMPFLSLDRIYFRDLELTSVEIPAERPWWKLSDHLPLVAEFRW